MMCPPTQEHLGHCHVPPVKIDLEHMFHLDTAPIIYLPAVEERQMAYFHRQHFLSTHLQYKHIRLYNSVKKSPPDVKPHFNVYFFLI